MSRTARAAKGFVTAILQVLTQIAVQLLLAPIVLKMAGRETLGAYSALAQVLGFISLTDFLGAWVLERFLGQATGLDDGGERFRHIFTTVRTVILFCDSVKAALVIICSFLIGRMFHLSPQLGHEAEYAMWVIALVVLLRSPFAAYQNASIATQDIAAVNVISTFGGISRGVASLTFVLLGSGLFGLMTAGVLVEATSYFFYRWRFKRKNPQLMPSWGIPDRALLREMLGFGANASVLNVGNALLFNSGNMIAGLTHGAAMASTYYTTQMPTMTAWNMNIRFSDSTMPAINELWGRRDVETLRKALQRITRLLLALVLPLAVGTLVFNRDIVVTWVGLRQYAGMLLTASLAAFCVIVSLQRISVVYSYTFGWLRILTITSLIQGAVHFGLAYLLAKWLGLGGIMLSLVIVVLPQTVILWHRIGRFLEINVVRLLGECLLRAIVPLGIASLCAVLLHARLVIAQRHFGSLAVELLTFAAVYFALAYPLVLREQDRHQIRQYFFAMLNRGRRVPRRLSQVFASDSE